MNTRFRDWCFLLAAACVLASAPTASALPKYGNWARTPGTGGAVGNAQILVVKGEDGLAATIYADVDGTTALANPFTATPSGYYEFYAGSGEYEVRVSLGGGCTSEIDRVSGIVLVEATGPQAVCSNADGPALTLAQPAADYPLYNKLSTASMRFERRSAAGQTFDAPWLMAGYRAEQGFAFFYNTFGHYTDASIVPSLPLGATVYSNTADQGNLFMGVVVDWHAGGIVTEGEGGVWLSGAAGSTVNVDFGISGTTPTATQVVALSPSTASSVTLTSTPSARAPFIVTGIQNGHALVAVAGIADVKVTGPVVAGDALVTSSTLGYATAAINPAPAATVGIALTGQTGGTGTVRARVGLAR